MADNKMTKIKFNSPVQIPDLVAEKIIAKDLTVQGTMTTENSTASVIEGAVTVVNGGAVTSQTTLMGQVILTGNVIMLTQGGFTIHKTFKTTPNIERSSTISLYAYPVGEDGVTNYDHPINKILIEGTDDYSGTENIQIQDSVTRNWYTIYDPGNMGWETNHGYPGLNGTKIIAIELSDAAEYEFSRAEFIALNNIFKDVVDTDLEYICYEEAYGILYDPSIEAVRLGRGGYRIYPGVEDDPGVSPTTATFEFFAGEGEPIAVRDLSTEDDGALVVWDAANYRLVSSKSNAIKSPLSVELNNIDRTTNVRVEEGIIDIRVDSTNNDAHFSVVVDDENDTGGFYVSKSSLDLSASSVDISCKDDMNDEHNSYVNLKYAGAELGGNTVNLKTVNGLIINEGTTSGEGSIAGGTTDTNVIKSVLGEGYQQLIEKYGSVANLPDSVISLIINLTSADYTVDEFKRMLTVEPARAEGILSIAYGTSVTAQTAGSITMGYGNISGAKGYYISSITSNSVTLSTKQNSAQVPSSSVTWSSGDRVHIVNDERYLLTIKTVSENVITFEEDLPFTSLVDLNKLSIPLVGTYDITNPNERSIVNIDKPLAGEVELGWGALAIGAFNNSTGSNSIAAGYMNIAYGDFSVAFGQENTVGYSAFSTGIKNEATGKASHAEGNETRAYGLGSHAEGASYDDADDVTHYPTAVNRGSHAEGRGTLAEGHGAHAEGSLTEAIGNSSHAEGNSTRAEGNSAHAEGVNTTASGNNSHAEGAGTHSVGANAHAEGVGGIAEGYGSHVEGAIYTRKDVEYDSNIASGEGAHAEGYGTKATGKGAHAEGSANYDSENKVVNYTVASAWAAHAEGITTQATGTASHSEGVNSVASGDHAHAEGAACVASGKSSHAEGDSTKAIGKYSHAGGENTIASVDAQTAIGKYNAENTDALFIIGNGYLENDNETEVRRNALEVLQDGTTKVKSLEVEETIIFNCGTSTTVID